MTTKSLAYRNLGFLYLDTGDTKAALANFEKSHTYDPVNPEALVGWADALLSLGQFEGALEKYKLALKRNPTDSEIYIECGDIYSDKEFKGRDIQNAIK